jgi:diphosphomevalonate decarboxylase
LKNIKSEILKKAGWISPSNIALVKYWGKHGNQLPANASISMTLKNSYTRTIVSLIKSELPVKPQFFFGGIPAPEFEQKIETFHSKIKPFFPFLYENSLKIESWNTFPHSAGIASSASAMSALALCFCDISGEMDPKNTDQTGFFRRASEISRLGSGSASRSVYGGFSVWGKTSLVNNSTDEWAVPIDFKVHPIFSKLQDSVLIVSSAKKKISSTAGHQLMDKHPFAKQRYKLAEKNLEDILNALKTGNSGEFIRITENEALGLHSLMMSSDPGFFLIEPGTLNIINKIRDFREKTGTFLCFTLDAGPNVHLIYPETVKPEITQFIKSELIVYCEDGKVLWDECGDGPMRI